MDNQRLFNETVYAGKAWKHESKENPLPFYNVNIPVEAIREYCQKVSKKDLSDFNTLKSYIKDQMEQDQARVIFSLSSRKAIDEKTRATHNIYFSKHHYCGIEDKYREINFSIDLKKAIDFVDTYNCISASISPKKNKEKEASLTESSYTCLLYTSSKVFINNELY